MERPALTAVSPPSTESTRDGAPASARVASPLGLDRQAARALGLAFLGLAGLTYGLIVLGALVRAHGAGLSCPDWPLCFGEVIPQFDFKVAFEWGHRALAGSIGLVFAGLGALTLRRPALRRWMGIPLAVAALLLIVQIVLGGLTVLELLASWTVTSHLVTGNAFALALVLVGRRLRSLGSSESAQDAIQDASALRAETASGELKIIVSLTALLLGAQIILGGLVSSNYAGLTCPDWPTCMNGAYFPTFTGVQGLHVLHRVVAYSLAAIIPLAAFRARHHAGSRIWLRVAAGLVLAQVLVGITNVLLRIPVEVTALHSALAAALICTVGVGTAEVWRQRRPRLSDAA